MKAVRKIVNLVRRAIRSAWDSAKSAWQKFWARVPRWLEVGAAGIVVIVFVTGIAVKVFQHFDGHSSAAVEMIHPRVSNPRLSYGEAGATPASEPTVTAAILNNGDDTAWVEEARVTVFDGTRIPTCYTQGGGPDFPYSNPYRVMLPEYPNAEKFVIHQELNVEVRPGRAVRPLLRFAKRLNATPAIYAIGVSFVVEPGKQVFNLGRFVIPVPGPIARGTSEIVLPENEAALTNENFPAHDPVVSWCLRHNIAGIERLAAEPGDRSREVEALSRLRLAPAWPAVADHDSPRAAVAALLAGEYSDSPTWAVEAAAASGDKAYEQEVRGRAFALLIKRAREELNTSATLAVADVERALSLQPSTAASKLLAEAKDAETVQEEQLHAEMESEGDADPSSAGG